MTLKRPLKAYYDCGNCWEIIENDDYKAFRKSCKEYKKLGFTIVMCDEDGEDLQTLHTATYSNKK